jgi:hypothetical protein
MASSIETSAWLDWIATLMGGASRQTCAATFPPDRFYCLLDELPLHLVPQRLCSTLRSQLDRRDEFFLNPLVAVLSQDRAPSEFASCRELLESFAMQGTIAWVRDATTESVSPFWLSPELEKTVAALDANEVVPSTFSSEALFLLVASGILTRHDQAAQRRERWREVIGKTAAAFQERGYAPIGGLIHPFHLGALRRYYRHMIRCGKVRLGDGQSSRRYVAHNESVARFFHHQIANTVGAVVGQPVKPSYVYLASYLNGAELKKHTDREQCEFSVTLCLDFSPEPLQETPWPIFLDTPKGKVTVYQALGDGLVYRGTRVPHYRDTLPEGRTSTSIFFHYVAADFAGSLS